MGKKHYERPMIEILVIDTADLIAASPDTTITDNADGNGSGSDKYGPSQGGSGSALGMLGAKETLFDTWDDDW